MKKLGVLLLVVLLLTGCGKVETKTCTLNEEGLADQTFTFSATNGTIDKVDMKMVYDNSLFGIETFEDLSDEEKTTIKDSMMTSLGLDSLKYDGIEITIDLDKQMTVTIKADLKKADDKILKKIGMDFTDVDMNLDASIKDLTEAGATCK